MAEAVCVDPARVEEVWPLARQFIKTAMEHADFGPFSVVEHDVFNGDALLWLAWIDPIIQAAAVTQVSQSAKGKVCTIVACGGSDHPQWIGLLGQLEAYAKSLECKTMRLIGRRGWRRVLPDYAITKVILEKAI